MRGRRCRVTRIGVDGQCARQQRAKTSSVSVHDCSSYEACEEPLALALRTSGLLDHLARKRVLLKPNMMKASPAERAESTHPRFVAALTALLVNLDCEVLVGDSSGLLGFTQEVLDSTGMTDAVLRAGGKAVNLDAGPFVQLTVGGSVRRALWVPRLLFEVDRVVQVPKLKTHSLTVMSAAVKNLMGLLPGATKCDLHVRLPGAAPLCGGIIDLCCALDDAGVDLGAVVVDGLWGLARKGSPRGELLRKPEVVIASRSLFAADVVCAEVMGLRPEEVPTIRIASQRGIGPASLDEVEVVGNRCALGKTRFEPAWRGLKDRVETAHRLHYWIRGRTVEVVHDPSRCRSDHACIEICPVRCIDLRDGRVRIGPSCIRCFACHAACPHGAIRLRVPRPLRGTFDRRAAGVSTDKLA